MQQCQFICQVYSRSELSSGTHNMASLVFQMLQLVITQGTTWGSERTRGNTGGADGSNPLDSTGLPGGFSLNFLFQLHINQLSAIILYIHKTPLLHRAGLFNYFFQKYLIFQNRVLLIHNYRIHKAAFTIIATMKKNFIQRDGDESRGPGRVKQRPRESVSHGGQNGNAQKK